MKIFIAQAVFLLMCLNASLASAGSQVIQIDPRAQIIQSYFAMRCDAEVKDPDSKLWQSMQPFGKSTDYQWTPIGGGDALIIHERRFVVLRKFDEDALWLLSVDGRSEPSYLYGPLQSYCGELSN